MSRLHTLAPADATAQTAELFTTLKRSVGKVPNIYATIGSNAPALRAHTLQTSAVLKESALSAIELEAINLTISQLTGCDYCLAAHTVMAKHAG